MEATQQAGLGLVALQEGDTERARMLLIESFERYREVGDRLGVADSLHGLGAVAGTWGKPSRAARLWGASDALMDDALMEVAGYIMPPLEAAIYEPHMAAARAQLGEAAWEAAWEAGRAMTLDEAGSYALGEEPARPRSSG